VKSALIAVVTLVLVASAAGSPGRTNGDLLLLRGQHLFVVTSGGTDVRELTPQGFDVESAVSSGRGLRRLVPGGREPTVSPDGRRLAFIRDNHLWIAARNGSGARPLTSGPVAEAEPDWGPR
jgi:hypothetical protein